VEFIVRLNTSDLKQAIRLLLESRGYEPTGLGGEFYRNGQSVAELLVEVQVKHKVVEQADDPKTWGIGDDRLGLSKRVRHRLGRNQIKNVGDLLRHSADELLCLRNFGFITLCDIREALEKHGLKLKEDES
jgi:DNA-directed RNA polymerase alpha subunit